MATESAEKYIETGPEIGSVGVPADDTNQIDGGGKNDLMMNSDKRTRNLTIDCLKGIMMIAVVLGHVIANTDGNYERNFWFQHCYSWHMFCFMAVSGYLVGERKKKPDGKWLLARAKRLLVPFVIWTTVSVLQRFKTLAPTTFLTALTFEPVVWYLLVQFLFEAIYVLALKFRHEILGIAGCGLFVILAYCTVGRGYRYGGTTIKSLIMFYPYYWAGLYIGRFKERLFSGSKRIKIIVGGGTLLYPIAMLLYTYHDYARLSPGISALLTALGLPESNIQFFIRLWELVGYRLFNHCIVSALGCIFYYGVAAAICRISWLVYLKRALCYLGRNSIYIYLLHGYFYPILPAANGVFLVFKLLMGLWIPCAIAELMHRIPLADSILFGSKNEKTLGREKRNCRLSEKRG